MIRREKIETSINHERWLVSYADFITLLFAFFVVMYSVSQVNESKYRVLSETLDSAFNAPDRISETPSDSENLEEYQTPLAELSELEQALGEALSGLMAEGDVQLYGNEQWVDIALDANVIFASSSAEIDKQAESVFLSVADILSPYENAIAVSGHTDNIPISNNQFADNWELSTARAVSVVNLLSYNGVHPERLSAVGYGEYRPVADNETAEGRAQNRRVVLRVSKDSVEAEKMSAEAFEGTSTESENQTDEGGSTSATSPRSADSGDNGINQPAQNQNRKGSEEAKQNIINRNTVKPVKLKGGGLLFSSDPDLPRINGVVEDGEQ